MKDIILFVKCRRPCIILCDSEPGLLEALSRHEKLNVGLVILNEIQGFDVPKIQEMTLTLVRPDCLDNTPQIRETLAKALRVYREPPEESGVPFYEKFSRRRKHPPRKISPTRTAPK